MMRNPIFESSTKRRMRSFRAPLLLTLYGVFLAVVSANALLVLQNQSISVSNLRAGIETHIYLSVMQFMLIVLVAPALTAGSIAGERERQTLDLLLCSRTGPFRIVTGKLLSSLCFISLLVVSSLPMMAVMLFFGGITFGDMAMIVLFLIVSAFAACSVGIFCSAAFKRTVTATVVAYLIIFAIGAGTLLLPMLLQRDTITKAIEYASGSSGNGSIAALPESGKMLAMLPKAFLVNPGIALFSLLVRQTGMLSGTFERLLGWRGSQAYSLLSAMDLFAMVNMAILFGLSILLTGLAVVFVKPSGRRAKKKND